METVEEAEVEEVDGVVEAVWWWEWWGANKVAPEGCAIRLCQEAVPAGCVPEKLRQKAHKAACAP